MMTRWWCIFKIPSKTHGNSFILAINKLIYKLFRFAKALHTTIRPKLRNLRRRGHTQADSGRATNKSYVCVYHYTICLLPSHNHFVKVILTLFQILLRYKSVVSGFSKSNGSAGLTCLNYCPPSVPVAPPNTSRNLITIIVNLLH